MYWIDDAFAILVRRRQHYRSDNGENFFQNLGASGALATEILKEVLAMSTAA